MSIKEKLEEFYVNGLFNIYEPDPHEKIKRLLFLHYIKNSKEKEIEKVKKRTQTTFPSIIKSIKRNKDRYRKFIENTKAKLIIKPEEAIAISPYRDLINLIFTIAKELVEPWDIEQDAVEKFSQELIIPTAEKERENLKHIERNLEATYYFIELIVYKLDDFEKYILKNHRIMKMISEELIKLYDRLKEDEKDPETIYENYYNTILIIAQRYQKERNKITAKDTEKIERIKYYRIVNTTRTLIEKTSEITKLIEKERR